MLLLLVGCDDFVLFNDPPEVRFLSPSAGGVVPQSRPAVFVAEVVDDVDALDELSLQWTLEDGTLLGGTTLLDATEKTVTFTVYGLPGGEHVVTLRATDQSGEPGRATLAVSVYDNIAPYVTFSSPLPGQQFLAGESVAVRGTVVDPDPVNAEDELALVWDGAAAAIDDAPATLISGDQIEFVIPGLAVADWTLSVVATDLLGAPGESAVVFAVVTGDQDMDGYRDVGFGGDDCDDTNAEINRAAPEVCDGIDQDCDAVADDDAVDGQPWFADTDGDGFGDPDAVRTECVAPENHVSTGTDCDDSDGATYPGAIEVCGNANDDDCDGTTDTDADEYIQVYADNDEDGFGDGLVYGSCSLASTESLIDGDCNDASASENPDAVERCDAFDIDEDCSGFADDADGGATEKSTYYADNDRDGYGDPAATLDRCDGDDNWVANADDCDDSSDVAYSAATEVCEDGVDNDCAGGDSLCRLSGGTGLSAADATLYGPGAFAFSGNALASVGDADGDGSDELLVGAWGYTGLGAVYAVSSTALGDASLASFPVIPGEATGGYFGWAIADCGDADGDGFGDFVATDIATDLGAGAIYWFDTASTYADASVATAKQVGPIEDAALGTHVSCGKDVNDDAGIDALVSVPGASEVWLLKGDGLAKTVAWTSVGGGGELAVALLDDVDGDGISDLAIGETVANSVYLFYGGALADGSLIDADHIVSGEGFEDSAGRAVASAGDINGDGQGDLIVGAPESDSPDTAAGSAYLLLSGGTGSSELAFADAIYRGSGSGDRAGYTVTGAGDTDGDGFDDVLVGAYYDSHSGLGAGAAHLFYGSTTPTSGTTTAADASFYGEAPGDGASEGLAAGDFNSDTVADIAIGAPVESTAGGAAGATYVLFGGAN